MASVTTGLTTAAGNRPRREGVAHAILRHLHTNEEFRLCAELQRKIWGDSYDGIVPASLIRVATHVGALTIGAFTSDGRMIGFVFGLGGVMGAEIVHWSHMLGVIPEARDQGLGRRLKEEQHNELTRRGVLRTYWTYDPLQARNAHLNLNRLGARVVEYVPDMYGDTGSPLHAMGTDRLVVEYVAGSERESPWVPSPEEVCYPVHSLSVSELGAGSAPEFPGVRIEVPWEFGAVVKTTPDAAREWRLATRQTFQWALSNGYRVKGLQRDVESQRAFYVMERANGAGS